MRLREFMARKGTDLAEAQKVFMARKEKEEEEQVGKKAEEVARLKKEEWHDEGKPLEMGMDEGSVDTESGGHRKVCGFGGGHG